MLSIANEVDPLIFLCICFVCETNMCFFLEDGNPFIQCNSKYPLGGGGISSRESLDRCPACTIHQDHTKLNIKAILV